MTAALDVTCAPEIGEFELDVAFTVESGMSVLFGPSGAGKSLTLALIAGLIRPDTGTIEINGTCRHRLRPPDLRLHPGASDRHGLSRWPTAAAPIRARQRGPCRSAGRRAARHDVRSPIRGLNGWERRALPIGDRVRFRAVNASGWRWHEDWLAIRPLSCSTSRSPRWITACAAS